MVGQAFVEQHQVACPVEGDGHLACQAQFAGFAQVMDAAVDGGGVDAVRPFAHQAHDAGAVGGVTNAGG
ncbi:hypothetical protein D3C84_946350 [compost metagenome]